MLKLFLLTLKDIGPKRVQRRIRLEIRKRIDKILPKKYSLFLAGAFLPNPKFLRVLEELNLRLLKKPSSPAVKLESVSFVFLNCFQELSLPVQWNDKNRNKLWQFHLHYFDWAREYLEYALINSEWSHNASALETLIDDWISSNKPGEGDGWNSYTISLRIRNLIFLYRFCPGLVKPHRITSLWIQLCWLQSHPENCHGGNHWLENLITLSMASTQFEGSKSKNIHLTAMKLLENELIEQILPDGGHFERSASYHLIILDRLVELGYILQLTLDQRPLWLIQSIKLMHDWNIKIRLNDGSYPRFNDCTINSCPPLDEITSFAYSYLNQTSHPGRGIRAILSNSIKSSQTKNSNIANTLKNEPLIDLKDTGWTFLRPGLGIELVFKCGIPCPKYLPAHVHSDLLSFDLYKNGIPLIAEVGTSVYGNGTERIYERSSAAHNTFQLGLPQRSKSFEECNWIEPVEVWHGFRAARKAMPTKKIFKELNDGGLCVGGSHDAYKRFNAQHERYLELSLNSSRQINLKLTDYVVCNYAMNWRQFWHLGPEQSEELLFPLIKQLNQSFQINFKWLNSWYSTGFGQRSSSRTLCVYGSIPPGKHQFKVELLLPT